MSEPRIISAYGASIFPAHLRSIRDWMGFRAWLSPAQVTAYADLGEEGRRAIYEHTIAGIPCFVDPCFPKDRIDFIDGEGRVMVRLENLAIPMGY